MEITTHDRGSLYRPRVSYMGQAAVDLRLYWRFTAQALEEITIKHQNTLRRLRSLCYGTYEADQERPTLINILGTMKYCLGTVCSRWDAPALIPGHSWPFTNYNENEWRNVISAARKVNRISHCKYDRNRLKRFLRVMPACNVGAWWGVVRGEHTYLRLATKHQGPWEELALLAWFPLNHRPPVTPRSSYVQNVEACYACLKNIC